MADLAEGRIGRATIIPDDRLREPVADKNQFHVAPSYLCYPGRIAAR